MKKEVIKILAIGDSFTCCEGTFDWKSEKSKLAIIANDWWPVMLLRQRYEIPEKAPVKIGRIGSAMTVNDQWVTDIIITDEETEYQLTILAKSARRTDTIALELTEELARKKDDKHYDLVIFNAGCNDAFQFSQLGLDEVNIPKAGIYIGTHYRGYEVEYRSLLERLLQLTDQLLVWTTPDTGYTPAASEDWFHKMRRDNFPLIKVTNRDGVSLDVASYNYTMIRVIEETLISLQKTHPKKKILFADVAELTIEHGLEEGMTAKDGFHYAKPLFELMVERFIEAQTLSYKETLSKLDLAKEKLEEIVGDTNLCMN